MKVGAARGDAKMSHLGATPVDDFEVGDLRVLTLCDKVPAEGNVF